MICDKTMIWDNQKVSALKQNEQIFFKIKIKILERNTENRIKKWSSGVKELLDTLAGLKIYKL